MAGGMQHVSHCILCALGDVGASLSSVMGTKQRHRDLNTNAKNTIPPGSQWQVQTHPFLRHLSSWFPEHYLRTAEAKISDEKPIK